VKKWGPETLGGTSNNSPADARPCWATLGWPSEYRPFICFGLGEVWLHTQIIGLATFQVFYFYIIFMNL
jgi:hypothetical protein